MLYSNPKLFANLANAGDLFKNYKFFFYCCPVNIDKSLSDGLLYSYKPLIEFHPQEYSIPMFKRTRISRITRTAGRASQLPCRIYFFANRIRITRITVRGVFFHVTNRKFLNSIPRFFYHPEGIREIRMRLANLNLHRDSCYS